MNKVLEKLKSTGRPLESFSYCWSTVYCKKPGCTRCPHGPYLYARWREGTKSRAIYIGRVIPQEIEPYVPK